MNAVRNTTGSDQPKILAVSAIGSWLLNMVPLTFPASRKVFAILFSCITVSVLTSEGSLEDPVAPTVIDGINWYSSPDDYLLQAGNRIPQFVERQTLESGVLAGHVLPITERLPSAPYVGELVLPYEGSKMLPFSFLKRAADSNAIIVNAGDYGNLFQRNNYRGGSRPYVGTMLEVSLDQREYRFTIRPGLKWSDGTPFTTRDIYFWWTNRHLDGAVSDSGSPYALTAEVGASTFEIIDDYNFRISFVHPNASVVSYFSTEGLYPWRPAHYMEQFHANYALPEDLALKVQEAGYADWMELYSFHNAQDAWTVDPNLPSMRPWLLNARSEGRRVWQANPYYWKVDATGRQLPAVSFNSYLWLYGDSDRAQRAFDTIVEVETADHDDVSTFLQLEGFANVEEALPLIFALNDVDSIDDITAMNSLMVPWFDDYSQMWIPSDPSDLPSALGAAREAITASSPVALQVGEMLGVLEDLRNQAGTSLDIRQAEYLDALSVATLEVAQRLQEVDWIEERLDKDTQSRLGDLKADVSAAERGVRMVSVSVDVRDEQQVEQHNLRVARLFLYRDPEGNELDPDVFTDTTSPYESMLEDKAGCFYGRDIEDHLVTDVFKKRPPLEDIDLIYLGRIRAAGKTQPSGCRVANEG